MNTKPLKLFNERVMRRRRSKRLTRLLKPLLVGSKNILDIGTRRGRLARSIKRETNQNFIGVDILVQNERSIPIIKCDGRLLPFKDNTFDCVMIVDVLHHVTDPDFIIKEAERVTENLIVIKDHYYASKLDFAILKFFDYISNNADGVSLPFTFMQDDQWDRMLRNNGLKIKLIKRFGGTITDLCKHVIFLLQKPKKPRFYAQRALSRG